MLSGTRPTMMQASKGRQPSRVLDPQGDATRWSPRIEGPNAGQDSTNRWMPWLRRSGRTSRLSGAARASRGQAGPRPRPPVQDARSPGRARTPSARACSTRRRAWSIPLSRVVQAAMRKTPVERSLPRLRGGGRLRRRGAAPRHRFHLPLRAPHGAVLRPRPYRLLPLEPAWSGSRSLRRIVDTFAPAACRPRST